MGINGFSESVEQLVTEMQSKEEQLIKILKEFRELNPWTGKIKDRKQKFKWAHEQIAGNYGKKVSLVFDIPKRYSNQYYSGHSHYNSVKNEIVLKGKLSVITFLHEWGHALLGVDGTQMEREKISHLWSENLFMKVWPDKWEKLKRGRNQILVKPKPEVPASPSILKNVEVKV
jgi:hypothetical protein